MNIYKKYESFIFYTVLFGLILSFSFYFNHIDVDHWARLLQGEAFFNLGHVLNHDIYSYIPAGFWFDHEWGSSVVFYFLQKHFGYASLILLKSVLTFFTVFFMIKTIGLQEDKTTKLYNILYFYFVMIQAFHIVINSGIRCHSFSFFFFSLFLYILELVRKRHYNKLLFLLPFLTIIWINLHAGCVAGVGLLLIYTIGEFLNKAPYKKYFITFIILLLTLSFNPYGLDYFKFLIHASTMTRPMIDEWQSAFFDRSFFSFFKFKIFFSIFILTAIYTSIKNILQKKNFDYTVLILMLIVTYLALFHIKHHSLFIIVFAAFLYFDFYYLFNKFVNFIKKILNISSKNFINNFVFIKEVIVYIYLCLTIIISFSLSNINPVGEIYKYPVKIVEFIKENSLKGKILAPLEMNSYFIYKLYPDILVYEDGRLEQVYNQISTTLLWNFYFNGDESIFEYYGKPDYIVINRQYPNFDKMLKNKEYNKIYEDSGNLLLVKKDLLKKNYIEPTKDISFYEKTIFDKQFTFKKHKAN